MTRACCSECVVPLLRGETFTQGVRVVLAESYERIHRSNLVGMGIVPLQYLPGQSAHSLGLTGRETFSVAVGGHLEPGQTVPVQVGGPRIFVVPTVPAARLPPARFLRPKRRPDNVILSLAAAADTADARSTAGRPPA